MTKIIETEQIIGCHGLRKGRFVIGKDGCVYKRLTRETSVLREMFLS